MPTVPTTPGKWAYGVTTMPKRLESHLPRTLASLAAGGFDAPTLFVDDCRDAAPYDRFGLPVRVRGERLGNVGNWLLSAWELYIRNPDAEHFALFEDDLVVCRNLRQYLDSVEWPKAGYLNLYSWPCNEALNREKRPGFYRANQLGKGAVALAFTREGLQLVLASQSILMKPVEKRQLPRHNPTAQVDGAIVQAMRTANWAEFCHYPGLVQHTGIDSSMGNARFPECESFPGEEFDAMSLTDANTQHEQRALAQMVPPGRKRSFAWRGGVMQIWITRACDKACFGCTQGSNLGGKPGMITPDQFREACRSLKGYFGVVGMFGGNPAMHPKFEELCEIMRQEIPAEQRGLWCNNPLGKGAVMRETFNPQVSNLNVHLDRDAYDEFKRDWPECRPVGLDVDSRHAPVFVAMQDVIADEAERWKLIADCDVNQKWSAMIGVFRGELRAWFCEIAGAQSMLHQHKPDYPDTGLPVVPDWWRRPMQDFAAQVRHHCHGCGVPLRGHGELAQADDATGREQVSQTHASIYRPKRSTRHVELVQLRTQVAENAVPSFIDYIGNASK